LLIYYKYYSGWALGLIWVGLVVLITVLFIRCYFGGLLGVGWVMWILVA